MLKHNAAQAEYVRLAALGWFAGPSNPQHCCICNGGEMERAEGEYGIWGQLGRAADRDQKISKRRARE